MMLVASFCSGHACDDASYGYSTGSHLAYIHRLHGTRNNHAWFKLNFNAYFEHGRYNIISADLVLFFETRMLN